MAKGRRLVIRNPAMDIVTFFNCVGPVESLHWSPDSTMVLTAAFQNEGVQVWNPADTAWRCKITDNVGGIVDARWSPCSRMALTMADFDLHICVWSLVDESKSFIPNPKSLSKRGTSFSSDGRFAAVLQRKSCKDSLGIFSVAEAWKPVRHFEIATEDSAAVSWSPTSEALCIIDTPLSYLVLIYSPDGALLKKYSAYEDALGIRSHAWSPRGLFLNIGSFDGLVRTLDNASWAVVSTVSAETLNTTPTIDDIAEEAAGVRGEADSSVLGASEAENTRNTDFDAVESSRPAPLLFEEVYDHELSDIAGVKGTFVSIISDGATANGAHISEGDDDAGSQARTIVSSCLVCVPRLSSVSWRDLSFDAQGAQAKYQTLNVGGKGGRKGGKSRKGPLQMPASGVSHIAWSSDGQFYSVQNARYPSVVWIWRLGHRTRQAALVLKSRVKTVSWHPALPFLAVCTGETPRVFVWSPQGVLDVCVPSGGLVPQRLLWTPNATGNELGFCLAGISSSCTCVLTPGSDSDDENDY
eukprot:INCI7714.1.p1 GENE.INCI7714.1~~INCI7714.1.p1  ORF type:complete len:592 (+),score=83.28 INCI7714.1:199-1776(+)